MSYIKEKEPPEKGGSKSPTCEDGSDPPEYQAKSESIGQQGKQDSLKCETESSFCKVDIDCLKSNKVNPEESHIDIDVNESETKDGIPQNKEDDEILQSQVSQEPQKRKRKWEVFPGGNKFHCNGRCIRAPEYIGYLVSLTLLVITGLDISCTLTSIRKTCSEMDRVGDMCIFVGDRQDAEALQHDNEAGITHILTLDKYPLKWVKENGQFQYLYHQCLDIETTDLLTQFERMFDFIDKAVTQNGKVLIHCQAGMSRSATIAVGYLMYKSKIPLEVALHIVRQYRKTIKPNPGFMKQLEMFEHIGYSLDSNNAVYKQYKLEVMAQNIQSGCTEVKESDLAEDVGANKTENYYRCRKCRRALFKSSSLLPHTEGQGEAAFDWRSKIPANKRPVCDADIKQEDTVCDRSLFIEPVQWMAGFVNELEGKVMCPKCDSKLGSFIWYGERCPCGTWVAPAFHIQSSKVDFIKPRPPIVMDESEGNTPAFPSNFTLSGVKDSITNPT